MTDQGDATAYTYEDAARLCGVTTETIRLRARRGKLRKGRPTNSNRPTVLLTAADIEAIRAGRSVTDRSTGQFVGQSDGQPTGQPTGQPGGQNSTINALTEHVTTLREQLEKATAAVEHERLAAEHERRGRELDRAAAAERETWLRDQLARVEARYNQASPGETSDRDQLLRQIADLSAQLQAKAQPASQEDTARPAWRSFMSRVLRRR